MAVRATLSYVSVMRPTSGAIELSVGNNFGWVETAALNTFFVDAFDNFGWAELAEHNYVGVICSNSLGLVAECGMDAFERVIQYMGWTPRQVVSVSNSLWVTDANADNPYPKGALVFQVQSVDVSNEFNFDASIIQAHNATNGLSWESIAAPTIAAECFNEFGFVGEVTSEDTTYERDDVQHFLKQSVSYTISGKKCVEKEYAPQVGSGDNQDYDTISLSPPVLTPGTLTLTHPVAMPSLTLVLKNPDFRDTDGLKFTYVNDLSRGGERLVFGDPDWPKYDLRSFKVSNLKVSQMQDLVSFMNATLGQEIGLLDWEGLQWKGIIDAPQTAVVSTRAGFAVTLSFQGERV